jgi:hypothetical protein
MDQHAPATHIKFSPFRDFVFSAQGFQPWVTGDGYRTNSSMFIEPEANTAGRTAKIFRNHRRSPHERGRPITDGDRRCRHYVRKQM